MGGLDTRRGGTRVRGAALLAALVWAAAGHPSPSGAQSAAASSGAGIGGGREQLAASAVTPGFGLDAVRPEVHEFYRPRHLPEAFDSRWYQAQTSYARDIYRHYVSSELEGLLWYDHFGQPVERGWLLYEWQQVQESASGSSIWKGEEFDRLFQQLVVASERGHGTDVRLMLGDELHTVFTPLTFSKPRFNGLRLDAAGDLWKGSLILARPSQPNEDNVQGTRTPSDRTDFVNLFGGHGEWAFAPGATLGASYVNAHFGQTRQTFGEGSPFSGSLITDQNESLEAIWVRLRDDSPDDGTGGALLFDYDIVLVDTAGTRLRGREVGFLPSVEGGIRRGSALAADGSEAITLGWDLASLDAEGVETEDLRRVVIELSVANDYHVEATSDLQTDGEVRRAAPVFLTVARAPGNVQDNSNATVLAVDYGLPTATEVFGLDLHVADWLGLDLRGELAASRRHRQYPNPGTEGHHTASETAVATYGTARWERRPVSLFAEAFHIGDGYDTGAWLMAGGTVDYDDPTRSRFEFVDDDDDYDDVPEWNRPYHRWNDVAWPGLDENGDFLHDHNQNDNLVPDYEEPFLRFRSDRPEFLPALDMNYNGTGDRFENDAYADYPYRVDHRGVNAYATAHLGPELAMSLGRQRMRLIAGDGRTHADYLLVRWDRPRAAWRLRFFEHLALVRDDIPDPVRQWSQPFGAAGRMRDVEDPLAARDTWMHSAYLEMSHGLFGQAVRFEHRGRWRLLHQRADDATLLERELRQDAGFLGWIDRAEWRVPVGLAVLEVRGKSEFRRQRPASRRRPAGTSLEEMLFLLWTQPLMAESSSVAYFPKYGRQLFATELQLGLELSRLWLLEGRLDEVDEDYRSWTAVAQMTNRNAYLGYQLVTRIGLQVGRRRFESETTQRISSFFMTVHAGLR